ncbi:MAG TPA: ABC transporter ATP-binding protein [bacterium]|nr:ABC transporter ATP-binding protein [bacterium]
MHKTYKRKIVALDGLNLEVPSGCIFGLLGPNGAGKSTAINIVAGVVRRKSGEVYVLGEPIGDHDYEYKRYVGFVLEKPHYIEKLTVKEYLEFAAVMYGLDEAESRKRAAELISYFQLEEKQDKWIETYSAGMKKNVSLAAALIHQPQLLLLDEPLEGIDPVSAKLMKENLRLMANQGVTIVISSHVLDTIENLCDEIAIITDGKRVLQSATDTLRTRIKNEFTGETFESLEEIFIETVVGEDGEQRAQTLSWLDRE